METVKLGNIFGYTGGNFSGNVYDKYSLSPTLNTMQGGNKQPMVIESSKPICLNPKGGRGGVQGLQPSVQDRVYDQNGISTAITTSFMPSILDSYRIRKLTPKECYRLMGFDDEAFGRAEQVNSNAQLYKQAGNSIVVDVLMAIFDNLLVHSRSVWLDELLKDDEDKNNEND